MLPALADVSGVVFRDYNADGQQQTFSAGDNSDEPGAGGITVTAYDSAGACGTPTTTSIIAATLGQYTLATAGCGTGPLRIEFTGLPAFLQAGAIGADSASSVVFTPDDTNVDLALNNPAQFCQPDPDMVTSCYVLGDQNNPILDVLISFPYDAGNASATLPGVDQPPHPSEAVATEIGTTWGLAYQRSSNSLFAGAFQKRHSGYEDTAGDTGDIYRIDRDDGTIEKFVDLNALFGVNTAGANPHPVGSNFSVDAASFDAVGKISLGDVEISEDELTLWTINLADRLLYQIPLGTDPSNPVAPTAGQISRWPADTAAATDLTDLPGLLSCGPTGDPTDDIRPFGLKVHDGLVYLGLVCSAEDSQDVNDLRAYVYSFDPATQVFTQVFTFAMDPVSYPRGFGINSTLGGTSEAEWNPWSPVYVADEVLTGTTLIEVTYPQPMLSDIEFDNGDMILAFRDRLGDQTGAAQQRPDGSLGLIFGDGIGDILRASPDGSGGWVLENNAAGSTFGPSAGANNGEGPGGGEFYFQDDFQLSTATAFHDDMGMGGLFQIPGRSDVMMTLTDPVDNFAEAFAGGTGRFDKFTGERSRSYRIYSFLSLDFFAKANGLGDLEAMCAIAPLELGNRVWCDSDGDGVQDPNEAPAPGVDVVLNCGANDATVQTDANGNYLFTDAIYAAANGGDNIPRNSACTLTINTASANNSGALNNACGSLNPTLADNGGADAGADLRDSDAVLAAPDSAQITFNSGSNGANNHSHDFGFSPIFDYGDSADPTFPTLAASNAASHALGSDVYLGSCVDAEIDGLQSITAQGDDLDTGNPVFGACTTAGDDEDGVSTGALIPGNNGDITVTANAACTLNAWIDWNGNGNWNDGGEQIFTDQALSAGVNNLTVAVPADAVSGTQSARFRCSTQTGLAPAGPATDGEVEDHAIVIGMQVTGLDFGDAPDPAYPTLLANNGASHVIDGNTYLGSCIDAETDGQPSADALGDNSAAGTPVFGNCVSPGDDEEGVVIGALVQGVNGISVDVTASASCSLSGWIDWNANGSWNDAGEQIFTDQALTAGINNLSVNVPANAALGTTHARFRCSTQTGLTPEGQASNGEVEDYAVIINAVPVLLDFGDAPDPTYPTLAGSDGASHVLGSNVFLGQCVDGEADGQPGGNAQGDDTDASAPVAGNCPTAGDDDDGVTIGALVQGSTTVNVAVTANTACTLNAWIDWNSDGDWLDASEQIYINRPLSAGLNNLALSVPATALTGSTFARFRCSTQTGLSPTGQAADGEVEDYAVVINPPGVNLDYGDALDPPYPTLSSSDGASHVLDGVTYLGNCVDSEAEGQPGAGAAGDDSAIGSPIVGSCASAGNDDDGVSFGAFSQGALAVPVNVTANAACALNAWVDWNNDGDWDDPGEQVFTDQGLAAGLNSLTVDVPVNATTGTTTARFRCSTQTGLTPLGQATDGEVEDYALTINPTSVSLDYGDAPDPGYPSLEDNQGASHVIDGITYLGSCIDGDGNGQPNASATGDDNNSGAPVGGVCAVPGDDDDGVVVGTLTVGANGVSIDVTASASCLLSGWIDWNANGNWNDIGEQIFTDQVLTAGVNNLTVDVPADAVAGTTIGRFRCSSDSGLTPQGPASDGEVEDYQLAIQNAVADVDFGDAPDPDFPTLIASNGASHVLGTTVYLGQCVDSEADGQPAETALADDNAVSAVTFGNCAVAGDDEDGVIVDPLTQGASAVPVTVTANTACLLNGWIDFNGNGSWNDAGEQIFTDQPLNSGVNALALDVPGAAATGTTYARFRCSTQSGLTATAQADDGEVEDYALTISPAATSLDYGDAPDPNYPVQASANGASHILGSNVYLGNCVDAEADGLTTSDGLGDDSDVGTPVNGNCATAGDDDDGVIIDALVPGTTGTSVEISANAACALNAWVDWNSDGDWDDAGEQIFTDQALSAGTNTLNVDIPAGAVIGSTFARFRCSTQTGLTPTGQAIDGEVEDYPVLVSAPPLVLDYGDAPAPYPTLDIDNGPVHPVGGPVYLGDCVDSEANGQPDANALGDDSAVGNVTVGTCATPGDDDDGVNIGLLVIDNISDVTVSANDVCLLNAWVDWNGDGDWNDAGEQVFTDLPLTAGDNSLTITVPASAVLGDSAARFRCSSQGGLAPTGAAVDGETEDYAVSINQVNVFDPPSGFKTVDTSASPQLVWQMVWFNDGNIVAQQVRITDEIPEGTRYVNNSLSCVGDGVTTVDICSFEPPSAQFPRGRVVYEGAIGPDLGANQDTQPDQAANELIIIFRTTVGTNTMSTSNQGEAQYDENNDGSVDDEIALNQTPVLTDDPATPGNDDPTVAVLVAIPTLSLWSLLSLTLLLTILGAITGAGKRRKTALWQSLIRKI